MRFLKKLAVPKQILFWPILKKKSRGRKNFVSVLGKIKNKMVIVIMRGMMMMMIAMIVMLAILVMLVMTMLCNREGECTRRNQDVALPGKER